MMTPEKEVRLIKQQLGRLTYGVPSRRWLSIGSSRLHKVLGSEELGLCYGKAITLGGLHSTAKSLLAQFILGRAQEDGARAGLIDLENSYDPEFARVQGMDPEALALFQPELVRPRNIGTKNLLKQTKVQRVHVESAEETFDTAERWMIRQRVLDPEDCRICLVVDSTTAVEPEEEVEAGLAGQNMRTKMQAPSFLNRLTKRWTKVGLNTNALLIYITQLRINPAQIRGNPEYIPGGKGILYYPHVIAKVKRAPKGGMLLGENGQSDGIAALMVNVKNKVGHGSVEGAQCGFKARFADFDWRFTSTRSLVREMEKQYAKGKGDDE